MKFGTSEQQGDSGLWCLMTFDDGYFNNFYALEVLEKYGVKVLLYSCKEQIERQELFWWDVFYTNRIKTAPFKTVYDEIQYMKKLKLDDINFLLKERYGKGAFNTADDDIRPLTKEELKRMGAHPLVEIGVHSKSHKILTNCSTKEVYEEISECKSFLEETIERTMKHLSYPNGNYDQRAISIATHLGFETAVTVEHGLNELFIGRNRKSWMELYRVPLPSPKSGLSIIEQVKETLTNWGKLYAENRHIDI